MNGAIGIAARLVALRERMGWSQDELAHAVGVSKSAVSLWESGKRFPRAVMVVRIEGIEEGYREEKKSR